MKTDEKELQEATGRAADEDCPFCEYLRTGEKPVENRFAFAKPDKHPFKKGHTLIVSKRHVADFFDLTREEAEGIFDALHARRKQLLEQDPTIEGFNVGFNVGAIAGQTVFHVHVHLMPRRPGDGDHPSGAEGRKRAVAAP